MSHHSQNQRVVSATGNAGSTVQPASDGHAEQRGGRPRYPYPGLRPFQPHEAAIFFGRGEHVAGMLTRLEDHRFLAVVGSAAAASHRSYAGLLPALEQGFLAEASDQWRFVIMRPGDVPIRNLASELLSALSPRTSADDSCTGGDGDRHRIAMIQAAWSSGPKGLVQVVEGSRAGRHERARAGRSVRGVVPLSPSQSFI